MFECKLVSSKTRTASLSGVRVAQKTVKLSPQQKLLDALVGISLAARSSTGSAAGFARRIYPSEEPSGGSAWPISPRSRRP